MGVAPEVTVVIPTRDRWPEPKAAVRQALGQRAVEVEVVVVDDGSSVRVGPRLKDVGGAVRVVRNELPAGVAGARNVGIAHAKGEWIAFLDDDDLWAPGKLRAQLDAARDRGAGWAYAAAVDVDGRSGKLGDHTRAPDPARVGRLLLARNVIPGGASNVVVRADLLRDVGGFDEHLLQLADWDLWIRLAQSAPAAACNDVLVAYVLHGRNMVLADPSAVLQELEALERKHAQVRESHGVELDRLALHRWIAWGHRRAGRRLQAARAYLSGAVSERRPGEIARAVGALLGERAMAAVAGSRTQGLDEPAWLARRERRHDEP